MQSIDSEEKVGQPAMQMGPPPRHFCVMVREIKDGDYLSNKRLFHLDVVVANRDSDGKFRAQVGEALSKILEG